ncbi:MAG: hypothetical protein HYV63_22205 [Candidatus Schekmanbacteria bacterium]|nr:hypothetical protein [Candidatus Schekmanbacteria bacterium]
MAGRGVAALEHTLKLPHEAARQLAEELYADFAERFREEGIIRAAIGAATAAAEKAIELSPTVQRIERRLDGIDTRLDGIDTRLDGIDTRLDGIDTRLDGIDTRLGTVETDVHYLVQARHVDRTNIETLLTHFGLPVKRDDRE